MLPILRTILRYNCVIIHQKLTHTECIPLYLRRFILSAKSYNINVFTDLDICTVNFIIKGYGKELKIYVCPLLLLCKNLRYSAEIDSCFGFQNDLEETCKWVSYTFFWHYCVKVPFVNGDNWRTFLTMKNRKEKNFGDSISIEPNIKDIMSHCAISVAGNKVVKMRIFLKEKAKLNGLGKTAFAVKNCGGSQPYPLPQKDCDRDFYTLLNAR